MTFGIWCRLDWPPPADRGHWAFASLWWSLCCQPFATLTMDHTFSLKEETPGLKVSIGSKTGPDWMFLDKQNQRDLPLRAIQQTSRQPPGTAAFELTSRNSEILFKLHSPLCLLHIFFHQYVSAAFFCIPDGKLYRNVFSSVLYSDQTYTIPSFVLSCFTVYKAPFSTSTQSLYRLDKLVMSHLQISVQLAHLAESFTAEMLHLKKK